MMGWLSAAWGGVSPVGRLGWMRSCLGALCGLLITGMLCRMWLGHSGGLPFLIAPMGASAVLLFAVPASPLAQPWSIFGGNTVSALAGITAAWLVHDPAFGAGLAVALALGAMSMARCLHPPGGAVAVTAVIGGPAIVAAGWSFALVPVALNSAILLVIGWLFNNATQHSYPHRAERFARSTTADPPAQDRVGYSTADLDAVLARYDELLDIDRDDLDALFRQVEAQAYRRFHGEVRCEQIMSRDLVLAEPQRRVTEARQLLAARGVSWLPVVEGRRPAGVVGFQHLIGDGDATLGSVMDVSPCIASADTPIDQLLPILSGGRFDLALITNPAGDLVGVVTQTDLLSALWRGEIAERIAAGEAQSSAKPNGTLVLR